MIGENQEGEDGVYLYFVAEEVLAANAVEHGNGGEEARAGQPNLYVLHEGTAAFIATLSIHDNGFEAGDGLNILGDWRLDLGRRSAQVSADGTHLAFLSKRQLTGATDLAASGACSVEAHNSIETRRSPRCPELYVFDARSSQLACASCDPTNQPPRGGPDSEPRTYPPPDVSSVTYMRRWVSADGSRVFFDTWEPILPSDHNQALDVYEWEEAGAGNCTGGSPVNGGGCLYLLSTGDERAGPSAFVDASANGDDVFLLTNSQLAATDHDENLKLYDARVNGGFPTPAESIPCEAEACKGPIASPPTTQSPGSASFQASEPPPKCRKGFVRKHGKCVKKHVRKHHKRRHHHRTANSNRRAGK